MHINWSNIPSSSFVGWLLRLPLKIIPRGSVVRIRTGLNRGMKWIVGSSTHGCWLGTYESDKQVVLSRFLKPGMTVFDVGANAGFYTLAFSRLVGDRGQVWAFEPYAINVGNLIRHIELNDLNNVNLVQAAVADRGASAASGLLKIMQWAALRTQPDTKFPLFL